MSIAFAEDLGPIHAEKRSSSQMSPSMRQITRIGGKNRPLRLDSPTTIQACQELGILVEDLKQKALDEFRDPLVEEDIIQLRFSRYMQRYNKFIKEVMARKRKILRAQQKLQLQSQLYDQVRMTPSLKNGRSSGTLPGSQYFLNSTFSPNGLNGSQNFIPPAGGLKTSMSAANTTMPSPMWNNYNKAMSYFRTSHETSEVKNLSAIIGNNETGDMYDETLEKFDTALANEVLRFNRIKRQKQKSVKDAFTDEIKKIKIMEEMKEKERKMMEREKKLLMEKKKADLERKKIMEERLEKVKETEKKYRAMKSEEKHKLQKRLDDAKANFEREMEEKRRLIAERDAKLAEKIRSAEQKRDQFDFEEQSRRTQLNTTIFAKLHQSEELHNTTMMERMTKAKQEVQKIEEQVVKIKVKQVQESEDYVQKLVEKLVSKEESIQAFRTQQHREQKKREKELAEKNKKIMSQKTEVNQKYKDRMKEINDRFQKVQDNLEHKREEDEKNLKLRQESTKIKISEKQDNCRIRERQMLYERQKILDKQKYNEDKVAWLKNQKDIMRQARAEASIQSKIERDRIEDAYYQLTKVTYQKGISSNVSSHQKRILRDILKPEDYTGLEVEERKKEQVRKEAEEKRKAEIQA